MRSAITTLSLAACLASSVDAAITHISHYGLGESGTVTINPGNDNDILVDSIGGNNFVRDNFGEGTTSPGAVAPGSTDFLSNNGDGRGWYGTSQGLTTNWSVQLWMKTQNTAGTIQFQTDNSATGLSVWFQNDGHLEMGYGTGGVQNPTDAQTAYAGDTWYRIGIISKEGTNYFYVDGTQVASNTETATLDNMTLGFAQGGVNGGSGSYDELNIWTFDNSDSLGDIEATMNNVPEPSGTALLGLGGLALILRRRK